MGTETLTPSETMLCERLAAASFEEVDTPAAFLGKLVIAADSHGDRLLTHQDLVYADQLLPSWQFYSTKIHAKRFGMARRSGQPNEQQRLIIAERNKSPNRLISVDELRDTVLIARTALSGSDLASVLEIEQAASSIAVELEAQPSLPTSDQRCNQGLVKKNELSELRLTEKERETIRLLGLPATVACKELGVKRHAFDKRVEEAMHRNQMRQEKFLSKAVAGGLINLDFLPAPATYELSDKELRVLRHHPFEGLETIASSLNLSSKHEAARLRKSIRVKLGVHTGSRTHTFLVAKRDGVI